MAKWKILRGVHADKEAELVSMGELNGPDGKPAVERLPMDHLDWQDPEKEKTFYPGDVIETEKDLSRFNTPNDVRFEKLSEAGPEDELATMTVAELEELAKEEEIEVPAKLKKAQLVEAIRGALKYRTAIT